MGQKVSAGWLWWRWGRTALRSHGLQPTPHGSIHQVGWWLLVSGINGPSFSYSLTWPLLRLSFKRQIAPWLWVWSRDSLQPMEWQHVWCHQGVKKRLHEGTCRLVHTSHHRKNLQGPCLLVPGRGRGASGNKPPQLPSAAPAARSWPSKLSQPRGTWMSSASTSQPQSTQTCECNECLLSYVTEIFMVILRQRLTDTWLLIIWFEMPYSPWIFEIPVFKDLYYTLLYPLTLWFLLIAFTI